MPGNLYGVSTPGFVPVGIGGGDVALPNDVDTVVLTTGVIKAPSAGYWYISISGPLVFLFAAAAPTAMAIRARVQGGSVFFAYQVAPALLVNNGTLMIPFGAGSNPSGTAFFPVGSIIEIVANPATNAATFKGTGSGVFVSLFHGPDL